MSKYTVVCCGCTMSTHEALIEAMVDFKKYVEKYGINSVNILCKDESIHTIKLIISKEVL